MQRALQRLLRKTGLTDLLSSNQPFTNQKGEYKEFNIGDWTYGNPEIMKWNGGTTLKIGRFCSIAKGVRILLGGEHHMDWVTTYPLDLVLNESGGAVKQPATKGDIVIGNDVWIGVNSIILSGVTIGDGAVVGAASVVTRDISPYTIVTGNPARPIRKRFEEQVIEVLLSIRWWDWPLEKIKLATPLLMSDDLQGFLARYGPLQERPGQAAGHGISENGGLRQAD